MWLCYRITFTQAETYQGEIHNDTHGTTGPIKVSYAKEYTDVSEEFLTAAPAFDTDRTTISDMNDFTSVNGYAVRSMSLRKGTFILNWIFRDGQGS